MIDTVEELQAMFCYLWKVSEDMQTCTEVHIFSPELFRSSFNRLQCCL